MKNKNIRPEYYLITKNFLTGNNIFVSPLLNQEDEERKTVGLAFLVNAPADYKNTNSNVISVFLDKQGFERDLLNKSYQIQCHEPCDNRAFNNWAERAIKIFNLTNTCGIISLDFNDLVEMLEASKNQRLVFKTFAASRIIDGINTLEELANSRNILAYLTSPKDITLQEFQAICDAIIASQTDKKTNLHTAYFEWPEALVTEVSILYAKKNNYNISIKNGI